VALMLNFILDHFNDVFLVQLSTTEPSLSGPYSPHTAVIKRTLEIHFILFHTSTSHY